MGQQDYRSSITANISADEAFTSISRVAHWWTAGFRGESRATGDEFTVRFGETFVLNLCLQRPIPAWLRTSHTLSQCRRIRCQRKAP
jgi:hypothetical protein